VSSATAIEAFRVMRLVVFKLGGSLLTCPDLADRVLAVVRLRPGARVLIVVGGGEAADVVRAWSRLHALPEDDAHWIAIRSMSVTRALVRQMLPDSEEVVSTSEAESIWESERKPLLLDVESYLRQVEAAEADALPHSWDVTSDSIAAWIASHWSADELVLLKSTPLAPGVSLTLAQRRELVDVHFPRIAPHVPRISWCAMLDDEPSIQPWLSFE
jgi:5-(aminomethyl)-3-furanmethanol phosphate kinase